MRILGIDLGSFNRQSAWHLLDTQTGDIRCGKVQTAPGPLAELLEREDPQVVLVESCQMAFLVRDLVAERPEIEFIAASTNAEAWRWLGQKRKTDASDAAKLVQLYQQRNLQRVWVPEHEMRAWRSLIRHRHRLVRSLTSTKNAIRHVLQCQLRQDLPDQRNPWTAELLRELWQICDRRVDPDDPREWWLCQLRQLLEQYQQYQRQLSEAERLLDRYVRRHPDFPRLDGIPGVGLRIAEVVLAFIGSAERFSTSKQIAAYAGMVPRVFQSGSTVRHGRITKAGNRLLRSLLVEGAWIAVRHSSWARKRYQAVQRGSPARKKLAIVAVGRGLLIRCWALLRNQSSWKEAATA